MKKTFKLGALALAILSVFMLFYTTNADNSVVSVEVTAWTSTCTLDAFGFASGAASATDVTKPDVTNELACTLLSAGTTATTLLQEDLSDGSTNTIAKTNIDSTLSNYVQTGSLISSVVDAGPESTWASAQTVITKTAAQVWTFTVDVTLGLVVPGGTPVGNYQGNMVFTYPA